MTATSQQQQAELHKKLWDMANSLRGQMVASEFKDYILGIIFYRFLSDKVEAEAAQILKNDEGVTYKLLWEDEDAHEDMRDMLVSSVGYSIEPNHLFSSMVEDARSGSFELETLQEAVNALNASTIGTETQESFEHLFDDLDLTSSKLGKTVEQRASLMGKIMEHIGSLSFSNSNSDLDILGDSYEFLIGRFSSTAGKSAGEFYTPQQVSRILAKIVSVGKKQLKSVYDPTCGSGSLLLRIARETEVLKFYGQELTSTTFNLARMNMMLHGVSHQDFDIKNDNTLTHPQHLGNKFEAIVANPPYSAHWNPDVSMSTDPRFSDVAKLAPKTKADFAFVQHILHHLDDNGTAAVVLPHGVLFRGAAEGAIRKHLIEKNYLDAIIGLPENIFHGTSIPTVILVFKKCREDDEKVLFVDASNEFEKGKNSNTLRDSDVDKIFGAYTSREDVDRFSRSIEMPEIIENDFNLNIPRYVDSTEEEIKVDLELIAKKLADLDVLILKSVTLQGELISKTVKNLDPNGEIKIAVAMKNLDLSSHNNLRASIQNLELSNHSITAAANKVLSGLDVTGLTNKALSGLDTTGLADKILGSSPDFEKFRSDIGKVANEILLNSDMGNTLSKEISKNSGK